MFLSSAKILVPISAIFLALLFFESCGIGESDGTGLPHIVSVGTIAHTGLGEPYGIAVKDGDIYFSDGAEGRIIKLVGSTAGVTFADGLHTPSAIAFSPDGRLIVADTGDHTIVSIASDGSISRVAGVPASRGSEDGPALAARFDGPIGVAVRPDGAIIVSDTYNDRIRMIRDGVVSTIAGSRRGFADGLADAALFDTPCGVAFLGERIVVADSGNRRIRIVEPDGPVWTLAGTGETGITDGRPYEARFLFPAAVATSDGELFIGDGHVVRAIRGRFAPIVETLTSPHRGHADGPAGLSSFGRVSGLTAFRGRLLAADSENSAVRAIGPAISPDAARTVRSRHFDIASFRTAQPARWPFDPPGVRRDIAGTLGEIRGEYRDAGSFVRFHNGLDIAGSYGETAYFIRDEKVLDPASAEHFETARELLRLPLIGYIHLRLGRDRTGAPFGDGRFKFDYDASGRASGVRVRRGAVFRAGEPVGTLNSQNHVHLIAGPAGSEHNALAAIDLPGFIDTVPPIIENVSIFAEDWSPLETRAAAPRIIIGTRLRVIVQAFDRMDGNPERRRLGVYRIGFKMGGPGSPDNGSPAWNIVFDKNPDPLAVKFAYAPGSVSGPAGLTVFRYIATNIVDGDRYERSFLDTSPFGEGIYTIRVYAADLSGNTTFKDKVIELVK